MWQYDEWELLECNRKLQSLKTHISNMIYFSYGWVYLHCCHGETAQCWARHRWHWQQNHSQMFCRWSAGCKLARIRLRGEKRSRSEKLKGRKRERGKDESEFRSVSGSHHSQLWVFAAGSWAAPQRWRSFPPHTDIPVKLYGTPEQRRDPGEEEGVT